MGRNFLSPILLLALAIFFSGGNVGLLYFKTLTLSTIVIISLYDFPLEQPNQRVRNDSNMFPRKVCHNGLVKQFVVVDFNSVHGFDTRFFRICSRIPLDRKFDHTKLYIWSNRLDTKLTTTLSMRNARSPRYSPPHEKKNNTSLPVATNPNFIFKTFCW